MRFRTSLCVVAVCVVLFPAQAYPQRVPAQNAASAHSLFDRAERLRFEDTKTSLEASLDAYTDAEAAADAAGAAEIEARSQLGRGIALTWLSRTEEAIPVLDTAVRRLEDLDLGAARAEGLVFRGVAERFAGRNAEAVSIIRTGLALARTVGDRRVEALALNSLGWSAVESGVLTADEKQAALKAALEIQRELPNKHDLSMTLSGLGLHLLLTKSAKEAIPILDEALAVARHGNNPRAQGQALSIMGDAYANFDLEKALALYREGLPLTRLAGHRIQEPYTLRGLGSLLMKRGRAREALATWEEALAATRELKQKRLEGFSWHNVGVALATLGERTRAAEYYGRALAIHRENGDQREEATTLLGLGSLRMAAGDPAGALDYAERALQIYRSQKDQGRETWAHKAVGLAMLNLGRYREAIEAYRRALRLAESTGNKAQEAETARWLGTIYGLVGDSPLAVQHLERAISFGESQNLAGETAVALVHLANVELSFGRRDAARERLEKALTLARTQDHQMVHARVFDGLGELALQSGRPTDAVNYLKQALTARESQQTVLDVAGPFISLGRAYRAMGNHETAMGWYRQALAASQGASAMATETLALVELMRLWRDGGAPGVAAFYGKQAVNRFQDTRANLLALDFSLQRSYIESRAHIYRELADILIGDGRLPEAQQILDLLKEQEYLDFVRRDAQGDQVTRSVDLTPTETASDVRYREISSRAAALGRERAELLAIRNRSQEEEQRLARVEQALSIANEVFGRWLDTLASELRASAAGSSRAFDLREAQGLMDDLRELGEGTVALYTLVGAERYRIVLITPDARVAGEFAITAEDLNRRVLAFREALENPRVDPRPLAQDLFRILIAPIASALEQSKAKTLMWSLDGTLRYVPVAALHDGRHYLIERYRSVVFTPASKSRLKDAASAKWHGVGAGVSRASGDFSALPAVAHELRGIFKGTGGSPEGLVDGRVLLDEDFTADSFRRTLRQPNPLVHIATHFRFRPGNETDSFLLLGDGTHMTLAEIRHAPNIFSGVELLTLSACNTAVGDNGASGAEVEGFAVIAQRQGAKAVLASLWAVADASTRAFMETFYRSRVVNRRSKAEAFQDAQLQLLRGGTHRRTPTAERGLTSGASANAAYVAPTDAPYSHPYYWAPFTLIGNWK